MIVAAAFIGIIGLALPLWWTYHTGKAVKKVLDDLERYRNDGLL